MSTLYLICRAISDITAGIDSIETSISKHKNARNGLAPNVPRTKDDDAQLKRKRTKENKHHSKRDSASRKENMVRQLAEMLDLHGIDGDYSPVVTGQSH